MMSLIIRRSAAVAGSSASRRALAGAAAAFVFPESTFLPASGAAAAVGGPGFIHGCAPASGGNGFPGVLRRREFHWAARPLEFRATGAVRAEYAVDDAYDYERGASAKGVGDDEGLEIAKLGIAQDIIGNLAKKGITKLFPIQRAVLEPAMQGMDMIGRARTGTGKTLAFGIPIMDGIIRVQEKNGRGRNPLAIVLAPTRELARQVEKEFRESCSLDTLCVYGGTPAGPQMRALNYGIDIVVGTPGRIIDLTERSALKLSDIQYVVLDEADQMLAVGFAEDVEKILEKLPARRQSMMFSATMPNWIRSLTRKFLKDPVTIDLVGDSDQKLAEGITLYSIATDNYAKPSILGPLIKEHAKGGKCIVFTQTKRDADRLHCAMERSFACEKLHGDIAQNQRERTLGQFRNGNINILIATDVAARGLDIPNVDLVIHYELPNTTELFVHRSGRTGRAGKKGSAILIYTNDQRRAVRGIEQEVGCRFNELPTIAAEAGSEDMFAAMNSARFDSPRRGSGFNRSGYGDSGGFGRSRGFGGSSGYGGRTGGFGSFGGSPSGSSGGFGGSGFGRSGGGFRDSGSGQFGNSGASSSGRYGSLGGSSSESSGRFGDSGSRRFGDSNSGLFRSNSGSGRNSFDSFNGSSSKNDADSSWPGRSFMSSS